MSCQNLPDFYNSSSNNDSAKIDQVNVSLGKGVSFVVTAGYMFNKYLGAEIGFNYLLGTKTKAVYITDYGKTDYFISADMIRFVPSVVITAGLDRVNPYAKFGMILGIGSVTNEMTYEEGSTLVEKTFVMSGGTAIGCMAVTGVLVKLNKHFSFFGELTMVSLSYAPTKGKLIHATYNNNDLLPGLSVKDKETEYVRSLKVNYLDPEPDDQPKKELRQKLPFGSFGISAGVRFCL